MGKVIAKRIKGMSWMARISLVLIFTIVFSTFIYQGWYKPKPVQAAISQQAAWAQEYASTAYPSGTAISYTVAAGTDRVLLVAIASRASTAVAQTVTVSYGGQALTLAKGDGSSTSEQHTYFYYLNDAGIQAQSGSSLKVTITGGTAGYTWVYASVFAGVNQVSPFTSVQNFNGGSNASASVGPFSSALLENTNDQPIEVILLQRSASGSNARTISTWASSPEAWGTNSGATIPESPSYNDGSYMPQMYITQGKIPTSNITTDTSTQTASSSSTYSSMTGISLSTAPSPTVTTISPTSRAQGATSQNITVNGTNFVSGAAVTFSGTGITVNSTTYVSSTQLTANVTIAASATTGTRTVTATNPDGLSGSLTNGFTVDAAPTLTLASPSSMTQGTGPTTVTLSGSGFLTGATVSFGDAGITLGTVTVASSTSITVPVTVSAGDTTGSKSVTVTNTDAGTVTASVFTVTSAVVNPTVTMASPSSMVQGTGPTTVTLTGTGFLTGATVSFGDAGITLGSVTVASSTSITVPVTVSAGDATGSKTVTVTNTNGGSGSGSVFTVTAAVVNPTVTAASPSARARGSAQATVTLTGTGFLTGATVSFGDAGITLGSVTVASSTSITVPVTVGASAATGAHTVTVTNTNGGSGSGSVFIVDAQPTLTLASPSSMVQGTGPTTVTLTGTGFLTGATVSFGDAGITLGSVTVTSSTSITVPVTVSGSDAIGSKSVTVTNTDAGTVTASVFSVTAAVVNPTVTSASPNARAQGTTVTTVTLTGTGFLTGATVSFGDAGITLGSVTVASSTSITVPVTVGASATTGAHTVTVTNTNGGSGSGSVFMVDAPPTVTSASPSSMVQGTGPTTVTITGTGFLTGATVYFGDANITFGTVTVASSTSITVPVTVGASATAGAHNVTVTNTDWGLGTGVGLFTVNTPVCTPAAQTVSMTPSSQTISSSGGSVTYTVTVKNNDTGPCASDTFTLTTSDSDTTDFSTPSTVSPTSLTLSPGGSNTATLTVKAVSGKISGTDNSTVTAKGAGTGHTAGVTSTPVATTISIACTTSTPTLKINNASTASANADAGQPTTYTVSVTNNDLVGGGCSTVTFTLSPSDSNTTDFNTSTAAPTTLSLGPGASGTSTLTVTPKITGVYGHQDITTVSLTAPSHTAPTPVTATTTIGSPLNHNSVTTGSTKWASNGGWGIPTGRYGEFACSTCHKPRAANIKGIVSSITTPNTSIGTLPGDGQPIVFNETSGSIGDTGSMGDDSAAPRTTSKKICEICHTYDATEANGVTTHAYNQPTNPGHYNAEDCMVCHAHNQGFTPVACINCHGNPPSTNTVGPPSGLASPATGATGTTAQFGAHVAHATADNISCNACHFGSIMQDFKIQMGFAINSTNVPGWGPMAVPTTGATIDVVSPLLNGYTWAATNGTTLTTGGANTCSNVYCHGSTLTEGSNTSPQWLGGSTQGGCGTCHAAVSGNGSPGTLGSHLRHSGGTGNQLTLACTTCHPSVTSTASHVTGSVKWALNTTLPVIGTNGPTYGGAASGATGTLAPSTTYGSGYKACSNVYCHSNVQGSTGSGAPTSYGTPTWGGAVLTCSSTGGCHDPMNTGTGTGSHTKHAQTYAMNCNICHNGAGEGTSEHADYNIELSFSGATAPGTTYGSSGGNVVPGTAYQTCSNSYCHSNSLGAYANPAPTWGAAGTVTCSSCHGNSPTTLTTGTHPDHLNNGATCNNCHNATAASDTTLAASFLTYHVDHYVSMELDAASGVGATYNGQSVSGTVYQKTVNTAFGACTNATCHVSAYSSAYATTPTWGNNAAPCGACHPIDANGAPATGSHDDHLTNGSACNNCHPSAVAGTTGGLAHLNGVIDVYVTSPGDLGYPEAVAKHASGSGYSTCTNASCHTSGVGIWTGTTSLVTTPTWGSASSTACSACHGNTTYTDYRQAAPLYTSPTPKPNAHSPHTTVAAINTGETQCLDCHNATISSTANNAVNGANHINGNYNVTGGTAAYASGENVSTSVTVSLTMSTFAANTVSTCANVSCHPNGVGGTKPAIAWNDTSASYDCTNCHNINLTLATSYHHSMNTTTYTPNTAVTTDYPTTVPQGDWSTGTNPTSRKCLMCHVKHNVFSDRMNASNSTGGRAMNLRAAIGTTPNPADTTTYSNSDYSGTGSNGICISCHTNELVKDQTRQKAEANGTHAVAVPNSGYSGAAHQYNVALTTKTGATTFNGNCSKCHNAENGETAQFYSTNNFGTHDSTEIGTTYVRRLLSALGITTAPPTDSLDAKFCFRCHSKTTDTTPGGGPAKGTAGRDYYGAAGAAMTSADEDTFTTYQEAYSHPVSTYNGLHKTSPTDETRAYIAANVHVECADCHDPHNATKGDHIELAGTATSGSTTTLVDTTKTWTANQWNGYELRIVSGTGTQQFATVTGTTAPSTLTFAAITTAPASGSGYQLVPALAKVLTGASSVGVANWQADSGTATAATTTSLTCSSKTWTASAWVGANLQVGVSGSSGTTGLWQSSTITANTSSVLTVSPAFTTAPSATTLFRIVTFNPSSTTAALGTAPTAEYQVCFKCHSGANANVATWAGGTTSLAWTDLALDFNPNNASRHPVASALATASQLTTAKLTGGWKPGDVMTCSDCHATDSAVSKGPHGSAVRWMLAGTNKAWPFTAASSNGATTGTYVTFGGRTTGSGTVNGLFCLNCHTLSSTNVMHTAINTWSSSHQSFNVVCVNCHIRVPHGGKIGRLLATANVPGRLKASGNNSWDGSYNINSFMATGAAIGFNCSNGSHSGGTQAW